MMFIDVYITSKLGRVLKCNTTAACPLQNVQEVYVLFLWVIVIYYSGTQTGWKLASSSAELLAH